MPLPRPGCKPGLPLPNWHGTKHAFEEQARSCRSPCHPASGPSSPTTRFSVGAGAGEKEDPATSSRMQTRSSPPQLAPRF